MNSYLTDTHQFECYLLALLGHVRLDGSLSRPRVRRRDVRPISLSRNIIRGLF